MSRHAHDMLPRSIVHPGQQTPERFRVVDCRAHRVRLTVKPGICVNEAIAAAFAEQGFEGGYVRLANVAMKRLDYVMPAASPDDDHAAWYSATHTVSGATIVEAGLHMGRRDGKPFLHCHGAWRGENGALGMGHLLPFDAEFATETRVEALALDGAILDVQPDAETNFSLFSPVRLPHKRQDGGLRAFLCTIRPNMDICKAIEAVCAQFGLSEARVHGIGSLIGADYADGTTITAYATEVFIRDGRVHVGPNGEQAELDIVMVDLAGRISGGKLVRGKNPICVTAELLLAEDQEGAG